MALSIFCQLCLFLLRYH